MTRFLRFVALTLAVACIAPSVALAQKGKYISTSYARGLISDAVHKNNSFPWKVRMDAQTVDGQRAFSALVKSPTGQVRWPAGQVRPMVAPAPKSGTIDMRKDVPSDKDGAARVKLVNHARPVN